LVSLEKFCSNLRKNLQRFYNLFQKIGKVRTISSCFSEATIAMIPKPGNKNRINNKITDKKALMDIGEKKL
jgi:hypothetical protein